MSLDIEQTGRYRDEILSVFYLDADNDSIKELFVLVKGSVRDLTTIEEIDEDGNTIEYQTSACCKDIYSTFIIKQSKYHNEGFLPLIEYYSFEPDCSFEGLKTALEVKEKVEKFMKNEN